MKRTLHGNEVGNFGQTDLETGGGKKDEINLQLFKRKRLGKIGDEGLSKRGMHPNGRGGGGKK